MNTISWTILKQQGFDCDKILGPNMWNKTISSSVVTCDTIKRRLLKDRIGSIKFILRYYPTLITVKKNEINEMKYNFDAFVKVIQKLAVISK